MSLTVEQVLAGKVTGFFGCSCHPFSSWKECEVHHRRKFLAGDNVRKRCNGLRGTVYEATDKQGFCIVKYGDRPCDRHQEHSANLEYDQTDREAAAV